MRGNSDKVNSERLKVKLDNVQTIDGNSTLTHNFCSDQLWKTNHDLCSLWPRMARTWSVIATFSIFAPPLPQDQPEQAKYVPPTNHTINPAYS